MDHILDRFPVLRLHIFFFVSKHSFLSRSKSLTRLFTSLLMDTFPDNEDWSKIAVSSDGLGRLLELSGFVSSDETSHSPLISQSQCLELIKKLVLESFTNETGLVVHFLLQMR